MNQLKLEIALQPKQKLFRDAVEKYPVVGFGGARGGGKSAGLRRIHLIRRIEYPGSTGVIFRETYPELEGNHIAPMLEEFPALKEYWNEQKKKLTLPNGSVELFRHCASVKDTGLYQGAEWHDFAFEEAGNTTEDRIEKLRASNRSSNSNIPARTQLTFNPGGIGHAWLKRKFITRNFRSNENPNDYHFIKSLLSDNPALTEADPGYRARLLSISNETLRKAWVDGDWDISAGSYFTSLDRDIHVVKPFEIPGHWPRFGAYDYGYAHPCAWLWFASDEDGNIYVYRELVKSRMGLTEQAEAVLEHPESESMLWHAGLDAFTKKRGDDPTIAEEFNNDHGLSMIRANVDRLQGASRCRESLNYQIRDKDDKKERIGPSVYFFDTCKIVYDCLTRMIHDDKRSEDVAKQDAVDGDPWTGDDPYDCFRYGIMSRPHIATKPRKRRRDAYAEYDEPSKINWRTV